MNDTGDSESEEYLDSHRCALCLGDDYDVPVFGSRKDALDFISPCSSCSLLTHRRCFLDWIRSLPEFESGRSANVNTSEREQGWTADRADTNSTSLMSFASNPSLVALVRFGPDLSAPEHPFAERVVTSAPCPQCKTPIKFAVGELFFMDTYDATRTSIYNLIYYGSISVVVGGALSGVVVSGYKTLGHLGLNIIDTLKPTSVNLPALRRDNRWWSNLLKKPTSVLLGTQSLGLRFAGSPLELDYVASLPIVMYRMRHLLIFDIIFNLKKFSLFDIFVELHICYYFSSLGQHVLRNQLWHNLITMRKDYNAGNLPLSLFSLKALVNNINWWDPNVMVSSIIPARWLYDLVYRLVVNKKFLDITASVQPTVVVNSLTIDESFRLEYLTQEATALEVQLEHKYKQQLQDTKRNWFAKRVLATLKYFGDFSFIRLIKVKFLLWLQKTKACLKNDYSTSLIDQLIILTCASTVLWPLVAVDFGKLVYYVLVKSPTFSSVPQDKLEFLCNLLGMGLAAIAKDLGNILLASKKAEQLSSVNIIKEERNRTYSRSSHNANNTPTPPSTTHADSSVFPGAYMNFNL